MKLKELFKQEKPLAVLAGVVLLVLLWLAKSLFSPAYRLQISPGEFWCEDAGSVLVSTAGESLQLQGGADGESLTLYSQLRAVPSGAYNIIIEYTSQLNAEPSYGIDDRTARIRFTSDSNPVAVKMDNIEFDDGHNLVYGRVWVATGARLQDFRMDLEFYGTGSLRITSVRLEEGPIWRWLLVLRALLLFAAAALLYLLFWARQPLRLAGSERGKRALTLAAVVLVACLPLLASTGFTASNQDYAFHAQRIAALAQELGYGQFPARIYSDMANGYGYATPLFYCDLFLYLPALLYRAMVPLHTCYGLYMAAVNLATALIAYFCFARILGSRRLGLLGCGLYTLSAYRLYNVYIRSAAGEYTAMAFLPLVLLGMWAICQEPKPRWRSWLPLAVGMAGMVQCHLLSCEITAVFLLLFLLLRARTLFTPARLAALAKAAVTAFGLSAWFLVPLVQSMAQMTLNIGAKVIKIQSTGLYPFQLLLPVGYTVGLPLAAAAAVGAFALLRRTEADDPRTLTALRTTLGLGLLALVFTLKAFPWDSVGNWLGSTAARVAGTVQFSWRYLGPATLLLTAAALYGMQLLQKRSAPAARVFAWVLVGTTLAGTVLFYQYFQQNTDAEGFWSDSYDSSEECGAGEYYLRYTDRDKLEVNRPWSESGTVEVSNYRKEGDVRTVTCQNTGDETARLILPVARYDHYRIENADTGEELEIQPGLNNCLAADLPAGFAGTLVITYRPPLLWHGAEILSTVSLLACLALPVWKRHRKKAE